MQLQAKCRMCPICVPLGQKGFADREGWDCTPAVPSPKSIPAVARNRRRGAGGEAQHRNWGSCVGPDPSKALS